MDLEERTDNAADYESVQYEFHPDDLERINCLRYLNYDSTRLHLKIIQPISDYESLP